MHSGNHFDFAVTFLAAQHSRVVTLRAVGLVGSAHVRCCFLASNKEFNFHTLIVKVCLHTGCSLPQLHITCYNLPGDRVTS